MEELRLGSHGFCGIMKKSCKAIYAQKRIFTQISLALLLPLSLAILAYLALAIKFFANWLVNEENQAIFYPHEQNRRTAYLFSKWTLIVSCDLAAVTVITMFALLFVGASVYTVACRYAEKPISLKNTMRASWRMWSRLLVTFIWGRLLMIVMSYVTLYVTLSVAMLLGKELTVALIVIIVYFIGMMYVYVVWGMASVISVLEDEYGLKSMVKAKKLVRGTMVIAVSLVVLLNILVVGNDFMFVLLVGGATPLWLKVLCGIISCLLFMVFILVAVVYQTVLFFVCKSNHGEAVGKSLLSGHLDDY